MKKQIRETIGIVITVVLAYSMLAVLLCTLRAGFPLRFDNYSFDCNAWVKSGLPGSDGISISQQLYENAGEVIFISGEYQCGETSGTYYASYLFHPFNNDYIRRATLHLFEDSVNVSIAERGLWRTYTASITPGVGITTATELGAPTLLLFASLTGLFARLVFLLFAGKRRQGVA